MSVQSPPVLRPKGIAHVGIQTRNIAKIRDWYCAVLNAHVVYEKPGFFCTVTFDDEHHRIAIIGLPGEPIRKFRANAEIVHVAFEMANLESFLLNWERLRDLGILSAENMNHGATLSSYYLDPDGNQCELFVDRFPTKRECQDWFFGPYYQHNFGGGTPFDPADLLEKLRRGVPDEEIMQYPAEQGMAVDVAKMMDGYYEMIQSEVKQFKDDLVR